MSAANYTPSTAPPFTMDEWMSLDPGVVDQKTRADVALNILLAALSGGLVGKWGGTPEALARVHVDYAYAAADALLAEHNKEVETETGG